MQSPAHRVALTPLQTAILRRVIDADGKLVRNQTLHALFQRVPSDTPFAERLTATIAAINQQAQLARAPGPLVHQVPLIGCVLADQVDVAPLSSGGQSATCARAGQRKEKAACAALGNRCAAAGECRAGAAGTPDVCACAARCAGFPAAAAHSEQPCLSPAT